MCERERERESSQAAGSHDTCNHMHMAHSIINTHLLSEIEDLLDNKTARGVGALEEAWWVGGDLLLQPLARGILRLSSDRVPEVGRLRALCDLDRCPPGGDGAGEIVCQLTLVSAAALEGRGGEGRGGEGRGRGRVGGGDMILNQESEH